MRDDDINQVVAFLYRLIRKEINQVQLRKPTTAEGFALEKAIELEVAEFCITNRIRSVTTFPARCELEAPSLSGQRHQFDVMLKAENCYLVAECKRRDRISSRDQILTFAAKIIDYGLGFFVDKCDSEIRGLFLSTATVPESTMMYALGVGIEPVCMNFAPVEYLIDTASSEMMAKQKLIDLRDEIAVSWPSILGIHSRDIRNIFESYKNLFHDQNEMAAHGSIQESADG